MEKVEPSLAKGVAEQYNDDSYSRFVQSDANSTIYEHYYHYSFLNQLEEYLRPLLVGKERKVELIDLGCGNGILGRKVLAGAGSRSGSGADIKSTAVDSQLTMLNEGKRLCPEENREHIQWTQSQLDCLPFENQYDCVFSGFVLGHASTMDMLESWFHAIAKYLKPGCETWHLFPTPLSKYGNVPNGCCERVLLPLVTEEGESRHDIELFDFHWNTDAYQQCAERAGLVDFSFTYGEISEEGMKTHGLRYEDLHVRVPIIRAVKPISDVNRPI